MKLTDTKILLSNYPNIRQEVPFGQVGGNETIDIQCGYDIKVNAHQVTLQIASDLITAILAYDHVYIEGNHIWDVLQVFGSIYIDFGGGRTLEKFCQDEGLCHQP